MKDIRPRLSREEYEYVKFIRKKNNKNVLVIGDLHEPFTREGYLDFCLGVYRKYGCTDVVFIGDIIDNHYSSRFDTDADGYGGAEELRLAKENITIWHDTFPNAKVCIGNHDTIISRSAFSAGISKTWIRSISEVLPTPTWEYSEEFVIDDVLYVHGIGRKANRRMLRDMTSVVQGHYHNESYIEYSVGRNSKMFAMQIGTGLYDKSYAAAYGKHFNKSHINCGVVLENGTIPMLLYMDI